MEFTIPASVRIQREPEGTYVTYVVKAPRADRVAAVQAARELAEREGWSVIDTLSCHSEPNKIWASPTWPYRVILRARP